MQEVFRSNDPGEVSFVKSLLDSAKIRFFVFDEHVTSTLGGTIYDSACRFMVLEEDFEAAHRILEDAGLFDDEAYSEFYSTRSEEQTDRLEEALDREGIEFFIEEDVEHAGIIPTEDNEIVTYRFMVLDEDFMKARKIVETSRLLETKKAN